MTLSPDVAQYMRGIQATIPPPPLPHTVKALIRRQRITLVKRTQKSGACKFSPGFTGLIELNGVWLFIDDNSACYIVHSHFETIITGTFESPDGTATSTYDVFHGDESFPGLVRCIGNGPLAIRVRRRWGCWPAFLSDKDARNFYLAKGELGNFRLSAGSYLWYGHCKRGYVCIVCQSIFRTKDALMAHFSLL